MAENTHETKIVISGDDSGAVSSLARVKSLLNGGIIGALKGVRTAISGVMNALGVIGLAINGVNMLIDAYKMLRDKLSETSREIAKMRFAAEMREAASETARIVGFHEKLSKLMKDELDTISKQREIKNIEDQGKKDAEDGKREADRARQIFEAKTPEEEQALRDRFYAEDEQRARNARKKDRKSQIVTLDEEESVYASKANGLRNNNNRINKQISEEELNLRRATEEEDKKAIRSRIEALKKRKEANDAEIVQFEKEAKFRRDKISALENQMDYEGPTAGEWNRKTEQRKRESDKKKEEYEKLLQRQQNLEDKKIERKKQEEISALDPNDPNYGERKKDIERRYEIKSAEKKRDRAKNDEDRQAAEEELNTISIRQERERAEKKKDKADRYEERIFGQMDSSRPKDRLTAMGLGSGAGADRTAQEQAANVKTLVQLMKEQVSISRHGNNSNVSVYSP